MKLILYVFVRWPNPYSTWFNGNNSDAGLAEDDIGEFEEEYDEDEEELPRTIRFRRRDIDALDNVMVLMVEEVGIEYADIIG